MKLAYIWYDDAERSTTKEILSRQRPEWEVRYIPEHQAWDLFAVLRLLDDGYDAILVHLSLPYCLALKMAEVAHRAQRSTKIILYSLTAADPESIHRLFDGRIHPDNDVAILSHRIADIVSRPGRVALSEKQLEESIVSILNSSGVLKSGFVSRFGERNKETFSFDDYRRSVQATVDPLNRRDASTREGSYDIFLSYASKNSNIAQELKEMLEVGGLSCFMAGIDIGSGDVWEHEIKSALVGAAEVLIVLTPESIKSSWVMIEAGAAWSLGKRITPCMLSADTNDIPEPISKRQARPVVTQREKETLVKEVKQRFKKT